MAKQKIKPIENTPIAAIAEVDKYKFYIPLLLLATAVCYSFSLKCGFVNWDDEAYISLNKYIRDISWDGIKAMFALDAFYGGNYHPLVALTNAIEFALFGENALVFHAVNVLFHVANTYLVFVFINKLCNLKWVAFAVAALFALHPMHVESVIWISERKDVLYSFFYLLALIQYVNYINKKSIAALVFGLVFFLLSLLSKSMAVTLPLVLLCVHWYKSQQIDLKKIIPTLPYFALAFAFGMLTLQSQAAQGYIAENGAIFNLVHRLLFVFYNFSFYIIKLFLPIHLCTLHPFPIPKDGAIPYYFYLAPLVFFALLQFIFKAKKYKPELLFGVGFFIASIIIVVQIIQVGSAVVAERYTYIPYIGLFYIIAFWAYNLKENNTHAISKHINKIGIVILVLFGVLSFIRTMAWENGITLWKDSTEKYPESSHYAWYGLANALNADKQYAEALDAYNKAIGINPAFSSYYLNRSGTKSSLNDKIGAIKDLDQCVLINPKQKEGFYNRGLYLTELNKYAEAIPDFDKAIALDPNYTSSIFLRGLSKKNINDLNGAIADYATVIKLDPNYFNAYNNTGNIYLLQQRFDDALSMYNKGLSINPKDANTVCNKAVAYLNKGDKANACIYFNQAAGLGSKEAQMAIANVCK